MKTGLSARIGQRLVAGLLGLMLVLTLAPRAAHAQFALTKAQDAHITATMNGVKQALMQGGKPEEVADQAALAIQASLIASYAKGLDSAAAEQAAETLVKAYVVNSGATQYTLQDRDSAYIETVKNATKARVDPLLSPKHSDAVVFTAGYAAQSIRQLAASDPDSGSADSLTGHITSSFKDLPPRTDPNSPFHTDQISVKDTAPPVQASTAPAPPPLQVNPNVDSKVNPDGSITELTFGPNGPITRTRYPGGPADPPWEDANAAQPAASSGGATQLEVNEQDLNAGQNNSGNTKNRTGSDDGKKDKDKQPNNSGGNGNSNSNSGGSMQHHP
jgi:hypothetical protein